MLDEDEHAQSGTLEGLHDPAGEFSFQQTYRLTSCKALVKEDCGQRTSRALLRRPLHHLETIQLEISSAFAENKDLGNQAHTSLLLRKSLGSKGIQSG